MKLIVKGLLEQAIFSLKQSNQIANEVHVEIKVDYIQDRIHGDLSTNLAFVLAKICHQSPNVLAKLLVNVLQTHPLVARAEVAYPGFVNFFLQPEARFQSVSMILHEARVLDSGDHKKTYPPSDSFYFIQYAHARICSVFRQLDEEGISWDESVGLLHLNLLASPKELELAFLLSRYKEVIAHNTQLVEHSHVAYYLRELANELHSYYNTLILLSEQESLCCARLCLLKAIRQVLYNGLHLLGVPAPETIR